MPVTNNAILASSQEERLQRVEGTLQDVVAQVAEIEVKLDYIQKSVTDNGTHVMDKLEQIGSDFHSFKFKLEDNLEKIEKRLSPIEAIEARRAGRAEAAKKIMWGVILAGAGVLGGQFAKTLLELFP